MNLSGLINSLGYGWNFDNSYARLPEQLYRRLAPVAVASPELLLLNHPLAQELGLDPDQLATLEGIAMLAGNRLPPGAEPLAQAYAGHQFGGFTMLGDGRAILLGEQITPTDERFDIQLKGSGRTPFSRRGDGRAALGPMLREYIISEAMHALGIPTTRSLAVITTGETVYRETPLPGAILLRVAASHLRVGTFEYAAASGDTALLKQLADYAIVRHYPQVADENNSYLALLNAVMERQAELVARWQQVGFIHGVLNTDNVALSGETIDYGPCAFMDSYDPATVFSSIDHQGRYAYANQPVITGWNLARFAEALLPLLADDPQQAIALAQESVDNFQGCFETYYNRLMRAKLGLVSAEKGDGQLIADLLQLLYRHGADYTNSFRALAQESLPDDKLFRDEAFQNWHKGWQDRLKQQGKSFTEVAAYMNCHNPAVIPRNHRVEETLSTAQKEGSLPPLKNLLRVLAEPYADLTDADRDYQKPPEPSQRVYQTFCGT